MNEKQKKLDEDLKNKTIDETIAEQKTEEIAGLIIIQSGQEAFLTLLQSEKDSKIKRLDKNKENAIHDHDESADIWIANDETDHEQLITRSPILKSNENKNIEVIRGAY
ncbi:unnamed protein product [Rotaria sordida]|uniref:Uncharacterized protein n=2 Tax=Rotaria sordida TaxID=392033 RepID=A0A814NJY5_9BILA|nr:unnamed protein product [Rotaria sordida]